MAVEPTPEQCARQILEIFAHFNVRANESLPLRSIFATTERWHRRWDDTQAGLAKARELGWTEEAPRDHVRLTETGFKEM